MHDNVDQMKRQCKVSDEQLKTFKINCKMFYISLRNFYQAIDEIL